MRASTSPARTRRRAGRAGAALVAGWLVVGCSAATGERPTLPDAAPPSGGSRPVDDRPSDPSDPPSSPEDPAGTPSRAPSTSSASGQTPALDTPSTAGALPVATNPALPTPIPPPVDDEADEPVIELGTIEIAALGVRAPLLEGIRLPTFDRGTGHWPGTAMPGQFGNAVVGGHRTEGSRPFRHLDTLVAGDEVVFTTADGRFVYHVTAVDVVSPDDLGVIAQNPGFTATLFACHPPGSTDERIVAHLVLAS